MPRRKGVQDTRHRIGGGAFSLASAGSAFADLVVVWFRLSLSFFAPWRLCLSFLVLDSKTS